MMRGTGFVPANVYGSVSSVNDTPPQKSRTKFPATSSHFMPASLNQSSPAGLPNQGGSRSTSRQRQQLPPSQKSRQPPNKFVPLLSDAMTIPPNHQTLENDNQNYAPNATFSGSTSRAGTKQSNKRGGGARR